MVVATVVVVVSVPFRGFRGLQVSEVVAAPTPATLFQSPSGVLGVCRSASRTCRHHIGITDGFSPLPGF